MNSKPEVVTWSKHFSQRIQKHYFVHSITKISQWETPSDLFDSDPSKVFSKSFSNQGITERGSVKISGESTKSTLAHLFQSHLRSTSNCDVDLLTPITNSEIPNSSIRIPSRAPNFMLKVKITYRNSPTDSRKIAQSWDGDMMFIDLLNEAQSKVRLVAFGNSVEVQLWNYDHTKEPMLVSMEDGLSATFEICDKIPTVEFLLHKVNCSSIYSDDISHAASTGENNEIEQLLTNIAPQLFDKNQLTTNINNLWDELQGTENAIFTNDSSIKDGLEKEQIHQLQIYKEPSETQIKEEKSIASEHDYFDHKKEEEIEIATEIAANSSSLLLYLPNSENDTITQSRRVRFRDDAEEEKMSLTVNKRGDLVPYADQKVESEEEGQSQQYKFPRLGDYTIESYDKSSNEMSINENCDENLKNMNSSENYDEYSNDLNKSENHDEHLQDMNNTANFDEYLKDMNSGDYNSEYIKHLINKANYVRNESRTNNVKFDHYNDGNKNNDYSNDDSESIDTDREEEFEEQEEFSGGESYTRDMHDNEDDRNKYVRVKSEDINNSRHDNDDIDDVEITPAGSELKTEHNNTSTRTPPSKLKNLCGNHLGAQLGVEKNGVPLFCLHAAEARWCKFTHISIKSFTKNEVLERVRAITSPIRKLLIPIAQTYRYYKKDTSKKQVGSNNRTQASRRELKNRESSSQPNGQKQSQLKWIKTPSNLCKLCGHFLGGDHKDDSENNTDPNCILKAHPQRNTTNTAWLKSEAQKLWANSHFAEHGGVSHSHLLDGTPWVNPLVSVEPLKNKNKTVRTYVLDEGRGVVF